MSAPVRDDPAFQEDDPAPAGDRFARLEQIFLALEQAPGDLELLEAMFQTVHSLKGASGFPDLDRLLTLARLGANLLDRLRQGRMKVDAEVIDLLFETEDLLKTLVQDVGIRLDRRRVPADPDCTGLIARLEAFRAEGA